MKRSFRVATLFTGAAVVTLTPAVAYAAPMAPAAVGKITPDAVAGNCDGEHGTTTRSVVLQYSASQHHAEFACVVPTSSHSPLTIGDGGAKFASYCDPEYSGYLWINGTAHVFTRGIHHLYGANVSKIEFTGLVAGGTCTLNGDGNSMTYTGPT
jgi:hypothetical protein